MRLDAPGPQDLDGGTFHVTATVEYRGRHVTVPVGGGNRIWQVDQAPSTRLSDMQIPLWDQTGDTHLLDSGLVGTKGHRVRLHGHSSLWHAPWPLGEYLITRAVQDGPAIRVDADDLSRLIIDHNARVPYGVYPGSTYKMILHELCAEDQIRVTFDPRLPNSRIPAGFAMAVDRWESVQELLTAWGAVMVPGHHTGLHVAMVDTDLSKPAVTLSDGTGGTLIGHSMDLDRQDMFNHIRVEIRDSEQVAEAVQRTGAYGVDTYGTRTRTLSSDAITGYAQAQAVAVTELAKQQARTVTVPAEGLPDWRLEAYEPLAVQTETLTGWGRLTGTDLPLVADLSAVYHIGMEE